MNLLHELKDFYSYLTTWNLTLLILFNLGYLQNHYYDLLFLSIFISVCSFIFTYIYPKKFKFKIGKLINYTFKGKELIIFDLICHQIPLVLLFNKKLYYHKKKTYLFVLIPLIYKLLLNDNYQRYGLKDELIYKLYFILFIFYFFYFT
tara:strand:+ start:2861 stop:3304 length:444 start_codon:yes stop_codon:yes gene_type:complete